MAHGDLNSVSKSPAGNELAANGRGNAYVNGGGLRPDCRVADGLAFPYGMLVTPDNATLIVAESYPKRLSAFHIAADGNLSRRRRCGPTLATASPTVGHPRLKCSRLTKAPRTRRRLALGGRFEMLSSRPLG